MAQENQSQLSHGAEHIVKRRVFRLSLKKVSGIVNQWKQQESDDRFAAKWLGLWYVLPLILALALLFLLLMVLIYFTQQHPKIQLLIISFPIGLALGFVLIKMQK